MSRTLRQDEMGAGDARIPHDVGERAGHRRCPTAQDDPVLVSRYKVGDLLRGAQTLPPGLLSSEDGVHLGLSRILPAELM